MLFAQRKERENRFKLALRTVIPSLLFVITLFVLFFNNDQLLLFFILMAIVSFIITYYNLYVIYNGFDKNIIDPETLLLNFKTFKSISSKMLKKNKPLTFLMIKLGDLEDINAHYGREQTNITLKKAIRSLLEQIDDLGFKKVPAGSFGGGIFILCFPYAYKELMEKIKPIFAHADNFYINDIELELDFSLVDAEDETNSEIIFGNLFDLINQSNDEHLSFEDHFNKEKNLEKRVKEAIFSSSLSLQYQEVKALDGKSDILEITAKLIDAQNKLIHHSDILPVINRLGLEKNFYILVIEQVLQVLKEKKITTPFALNITAFALRHKEVTQRVLKFIKNYQLHPAQMILVVNENRFYKHLQRYKDIIDTYRSEGVLIAFSDIGSVSPALEYLKFIDVDFIRYDRTLAQNCDDPRLRSVFMGLNLMAEDRGIKKWAIMVETEAMQLKLTEMGIEYLQGRHIAPLKNIDSLGIH